MRGFTTRFKSEVLSVFVYVLDEITVVLSA